jgi:hypothetical protein
MTIDSKRGPALLAAAIIAALPAAAQAQVVNAARYQASANSASWQTSPAIGLSAPLPHDAGDFGVFRTCPIGKTCALPADYTYALVIDQASPYYAGLGWNIGYPYDPSLTGSWQLLRSRNPAFPPGGTTVYTSAALGTAVQQLPFLAGMRVSSAGLSPTLTWTMPALATGMRVDAVRVTVTDLDQPAPFTSRTPGAPLTLPSGTIVFSTLLPAAATSFTLPSSWVTESGHTLSLAYGHRYSFGIGLSQARAGDFTQGIESMSDSFFEMTPLASLPGDVYLPTVIPGASSSAYRFRFDVAPGAIYYIDPVVAEGFEYRVAAGDPLITSVRIATHAGDGLYDLYLPAGDGWALAKAGLAAGQAYDFGAAGVAAFQVRGIESGANVSPVDVTAFVTGLTFASAGAFNGTMQALVVPEPGTLLLMLVGLGGLAWRRQAERA